ncbi:MAG: hypothetical protein M3R55_14590 [Acidobacteriota bacterium]|nr:hypothetical protein [Acidobacteriota bacterium]
MTTLFACVPLDAAAQVLMRPEAPPARLATATDWYRTGEAVLYRGDNFYPAGPQVFFDGGRMVLIGEFRGIPIYADSTLEPGSIVYVPIDGGLVQPYEKPRAGDLAGTTGSRAPSFPSTPATSIEATPETAGTAGTLPARPGADAAVTGDTATAKRSSRSNVETIAPAGAARGRGIWISWNGASWRSDGASARMGTKFVRIGTYGGRAVYRGAGEDATIWIETAKGMAAPWRR